MISLYNNQIQMLSQKQMAEAKEQIKREILDIDHQVHELETFYLQDTKQAGNLLRGFDNYISLKTSKIQSVPKKQKVQNYERLFSLSSVTSKTSQIVEDSLIGDLLKMDVSSAAPKRNRPRQGGKTKSGGKNLMREQNMMEQEESSESGQGDGGDDSLQDSMGKNRGTSKKKKINKLVVRKN